MNTVSEIYNFIDEFAPFDSAMSFDNVGLLVHSSDNISKVLICLDITDEAINKAVEMKAELIISHHPVIFNPIKKISYNDVIFKLIKNGISAICAHTNLDMGKGGVNDTLAETLGLKNIIPFSYYNDVPCAICGELSNKMIQDDFIKLVKDKLKCEKVRYVLGNKKIQSVAVCSGAGSDILLETEKKADALVTGEVKYHEFLFAHKMGITIIEAGHFETENIVVKKLNDKLLQKFPNTEFFAFDSMDLQVYHSF